MDCDSCGKTLRNDGGVCPQCEPPGRSTGGRAATEESRPLLTDGGEDPLAPSNGDSDERDDDMEAERDDGGSADESDMERDDPVATDESESDSVEAETPTAEPPGDESPAGGGETDAGATEPDTTSEEPKDGEYLEPNDIVGDELDEGAPDQAPPADEAGSGAESPDQPPAGTPAQESPAAGSEEPVSDEPTADEPAGAADEHSPQDEPGQQPPTGGGDQKQHSPDSSGEQPPSGQPAQPATGQQPPEEPAEQRPAGQPQQGQQSAQGEPEPRPQGQGSQAAGPGGGQPGHQQPTEPEASQQSALVEKISEFPLVLGTLFGAAAALVPFAILSALTIVASEQPVTIIRQDGQDAISGGAGTTGQTLEGLDVAAELLFSFLTYGSGARIRDVFVTAADTDLAAVDPADYPNWQSELEVLVGSGDGMLFSTPEAVFIVLYILTPYILFIGSRFLARHYAPSDSLVDHIGTGLTVTLGILPVLLLFGLVFTTTTLSEPILIGGLATPLIIGSVGGLTVYAYEDISQLYSKFFGWGAIVLSLLFAFVLLPTPSAGAVTNVNSFATRAFIGLASYLDVMQLNLGRGIEGYVLFGSTMVITFFAGFLRVWVAREKLQEPLHGARVGASIFLGFVATIALLLWVYPLSLVFTDLTFGIGTVEVAYFQAILGSGQDYLVNILLGGVLVPMVLGASGGAAALILYQQNQQNQRRQQNQADQGAPRNQQPPQ